VGKWTCKKLQNIYLFLPKYPAQHVNSIFASN
jgi:hypothetical protein